MKFYNSTSIYSFIENSLLNNMKCGLSAENQIYQKYLYFMYKKIICYRFTKK